MSVKYILIFLLLLLIGCGETPTPKPYGYFRITMPPKEYARVDSMLPYSFDLPRYSKLESNKPKGDDKYWSNIQFPIFNSTIHISYKSINGNLAEILDDSHTMAYKHSVKADAIKENGFFRPDKRVFGVVYEIKGEAASSLQFIVTDSVNHFVRGALYFNSKPNKDSLAPVVAFLKSDIVRLMESFEWSDVK